MRARPHGMAIRRGLALAVVALAGLLLAGIPAMLARDTGATVTLDPAHRFQTIAGWEATADLPDHPGAPEWDGYIDALLDRAVSDVGITRIRLEVRSGAETRSDDPDRFMTGKIGYDQWKTLRYKAENDNDDPFDLDPSGFNFAELDWHVRHTVLPLRERIEARGGRLVVNLCYVAFRSGRFFQMEPEEYAEFVLATYRHLDETFGFTPDLWEVMLEPDLKERSWTGHDMGLAMAATAKRLREAGYTPAFVAPSVTNMANTLPYAREILAVPGARDAWRELSYHRYRGTSPQTLKTIADFARANGLDTAMLELWFGRAGPRVLYEDLAIGNNVAWQGRVVQGLLSFEDGRLDYAPEVRFTRLYFTAIRPGAVRIGAASDALGRVAPVAFVNPGGGTAVVLLLDRTTRAGDEVTLRGLPPGRYALRWATTTDSLDTPRELTAGADGGLVLTLPGGAGVLSLVAE